MSSQMVRFRIIVDITYMKQSTANWTLAATIMASAMAFIDATALNVILPSLQKDLDASGTDLFWVLNSYLLMLASLIIVGGSLGDQLGRVKVFAGGIVVFCSGSILCGLSADITQLIIFRTIQGIGGAFMIPGSLSIISATFPKASRGKAIGTWSSVTTIVTIGGPVLGGTLADLGLWRYIFYINVPIALIILPILYLKIPESKSEGNNRVDFVGATLMVVSLIGITFGFLNAPEVGWKSVKSYLPVAIGFIFLFLFIYSQKKIQLPMVPLRLFKIRTFSGVNLLSFVLYAALGAVMLFLSLNMIQIQGYSQFQTGLTFLPFPIIMALVARRVGRMADQYGLNRFLIFGPIITGIGFIYLGFIGQTNGPSEYWTTFLPGILIFASGMSITVVPLTTAVMNAVTDNEAGIASGINNSVTRIANTFANAVIGSFAVYFFITLVANNLAPLGLDTQTMELLMEEAKELGEASAPADLSASVRSSVQSVFDQSFLSTYQLIAIVSGILAISGGLISWGSIQKD